MYRNRAFTIILILIILLTSCASLTKTEPKVLFILEEHSIHLHFSLKSEVGVMAKMVEDAGYKVVYASESGEPLGRDDVIIKPDIKLEDVNVNDYVGIVLPCLAISTTRAMSPATNKIIAEAASAGKPIAAASGAIFSLHRAGVLDGRKFAAADFDAQYINVGTYMGDSVFQDGNIITSAYCPFAQEQGFGNDETTELTQKFIDALKS